MSMMEQTIKCKICGKPYIFCAYSAADQSVCSKCIKIINKKCPHIGQEICPCIIYGE